MFIIARQDFSVTYGLGLEPAEIARGRGLIRKTLPGWGLGEHIDVAELIVDELTTNAQRYGSCPIEVYLCYDGRSLHIGVWDSSDAMPRRRYPGADDEVGRGLQIVDSLAKEYGGTRGSIRRAALPGKTVYVTLTIQTGLPVYANRLPG